jgi:hypothetical protein
VRNCLSETTTPLRIGSLGVEDAIGSLLAVGSPLADAWGGTAAITMRGIDTAGATLGGDDIPNGGCSELMDIVGIRADFWFS